VNHVIAQNPNSDYAAVLTNTGSARTVWIKQGKNALEVALPGDAVVTLEWK
jgi:hypothetical protein